MIIDIPTPKMKKKAYREVKDIPINKQVYAYIGSHKTILSIGCNTGVLEALLKKKENKVYGIDINEKAIKLAAQSLDEAYVLDVNSIKELPFKKECFDIIILADILEHLSQPQALLELISPYIKAQGYILVSLPNVANWSIRLNLLLGNFTYTSHGILDRTHLHFFTLRTAKKLFLNAGYEIYCLDYTTNLVNILYEKLRKKNTRLAQCVPIQGYNPPQSSLRKYVRYIIEQVDEWITSVYPSLFAYQFIFIIKKKESN